MWISKMRCYSYADTHTHSQSVGFAAVEVKWKQQWGIEMNSVVEWKIGFASREREENGKEARLQDDWEK